MTDNTDTDPDELPAVHEFTIDLGEGNYQNVGLEAENRDEAREMVAEMYPGYEILPDTNPKTEETETK